VATCFETEQRLKALIALNESNRLKAAVLSKASL
jgi:hypothetical protein